MQLGMIGLGRMGANMVKRLLEAGHESVVYDTNPDAVAGSAADDAIGCDSLRAMCDKLQPPSGPYSNAGQGYPHCGPTGAGHFVKMVHNVVEYALMAAFAEGFNLLKHAGVGIRRAEEDAETAPMENPEHYQYDIDLAQVAEVWRRGSVVSCWLLDLTANALNDDTELSDFSGKVSDSGECRWTCLAAIETGTPAPMLTTALYERFRSRGKGRPCVANSAGTVRKRSRRGHVVTSGPRAKYCN